MSKVYIIIPCREGGTRLPNKALLNETDKNLFVHTFDNCLTIAGHRSILAEVFITTDSQTIIQICKRKGIPCIETGNCRNGTERVCDAVNRLNLYEDDFVFNCQVDYPLLEWDLFAKILQVYKSFDRHVKNIYTTYYSEDVKFFEADKVKIALGVNGYIHYFSRAQIPWKVQKQYIHVGLYGYKYPTLRNIAYRHNAFLESEDLEQLHWLDWCRAIGVSVEKSDSLLSINTRADYDKFKAILAANSGGKHEQT